MKHGGGSVMICNCFSGFGMGSFHEIDVKMDRFMYRDILQNIMMPHADWEMPLLWMFQHDNDPKHTSKLVKDWILENGIQTLDWPAQSPDFNPIENLFGVLKRRVAGQNFNNKRILKQSLENEWKRIPLDIIRHLIDSMHSRCLLVIKNNDYYKKY